MQTFLRLNGYNLNLSEEEKYSLVLQVAQGQLCKKELASYLKQHLAETTHFHCPSADSAMDQGLEALVKGEFDKE